MRVLDEDFKNRHYIVFSAIQLTVPGLGNLAIGANQNAAPLRVITVRDMFTT